MVRVASAIAYDDAKREVLTRLGQLDDGVANPALIAEAGAMINVAIRKLPSEHPHLIPRTFVTRQVAAGQSLLSLPSDAHGAEIKEIRQVDSNQGRYRLNGDIARGQLRLGLMDSWELVETVGITQATVLTGGTGHTGSTTIAVTGGSRETRGDQPALRAVIASGVITDLLLDATGTGWLSAPVLSATIGSGATFSVTIGQVPAIELAPATVAATLEIEYRRRPVSMSSDTDLLPFDAEAIISYAAALHAAAKGLAIAQVLGDTFKSYTDGVRRRQQPPRIASLHSWRTDG